MMLDTIAQSWPIAIMFIALLAFLFGMRIVSWFKKSDEQDKAIRASQAVVVRPTRHGEEG